MVTAELAVAVPTLLLVLSICVGVVAVVAARVRCIDAAAVAARLTARGETGDTVTTQIRAIVPHAIVTVRRSANGFVEVDVRQRLQIPVVRGLLPAVTVDEHLAVPDESMSTTPAERGP